MRGEEITDIKITDALPEQLEQIELIEKACFSSPWMPEMLRRQMEPKENIFLAASANGTVAGYVGLMFVLDEGYISNVAVAPQYRRTGIAQRLLTELERRGREKNLSFLTLEVRESNIPAVALYEKLGYKKTGVRKNYYEKPKENAIIMTLELI